MTAAAETYGRALAAHHAGDDAQCAALSLEALKQQPGFGGAHLLRGVALMQDDQMLAVAHLAAACRQSPTDAEAWYNYGVFLEKAGQLAEAMGCYRRAIALDPTHVNALANGTQLIRLHEHFEEALVLARRMIRMLPDKPHGYTHAAIALQYLGRLAEADEAFAQAEALSDDPAHLHWEHHFSLLATQQFAPAWDCYEYRFSPTVGNGVSDYPFDRTRWDGGHSDHVLVYGEQGLGDQIMFASALRDMQAACGRVTLAVSALLVDLFAASFPDITVLPLSHDAQEEECARLLETAGAQQPVDTVLAIGSLMARFRTDRASYTGAPYLVPSADATAFWQTGRPQFADAGDGRFKLGLCWASNPAPDMFHSSRRAGHKTMPLDTITALARVPDVDAVAITNVPLHAFPGHDAASAIVADVSADLVNLDRTAALLKNLDLLITVDTGVAHLAGALGVPVWVLLHTRGDARWGQQGSRDSYWYDSARLYWQDEPGDWFGLIARVRSDLDRVVGARQAERVA